MDDTPGSNSLRNDFSDLNADMLHAVMELVSDGIWDWNANTGFVYRNPGWYEMLGYPPPLPGEQRVHLGEHYPPGRLPSRHGSV